MTDEQGSDAGDYTADPMFIPAEQLLVEFVPTGDPRVDGAVDRLGDLDDLPVEEHPAVFEDIHKRLQGALSEE